ncbi:Uncharacterized membrane protein [Austwickia chelonae]|uniref:DUF2243 domain-containing protein n=1 Tax=Austwickia chelonae NBRC 105200 TaxID=1184607 RepID=K6VLH3_9MICO|nr:DUF2243 domain-containing protein [Austwickia chelonae]GAB77559.1 hypothetical protein AUCHE_05_04720 [Austwickia chelonae NBRC 105200]SEW12878.1 Uncharacterized membrane protein [Austwickia chelonae]
MPAPGTRPIQNLDDTATHVPDRRVLLSGFLFGCGIAASLIDLFVFHLGLQWHHFYDLSTTEVALTADGFFHAFGWFITVWGAFLLFDARRRGSFPWFRWVGAVICGVGFFQLFDGVVDHKLLRIHQIRYDVELLPYDIVWIGSALLLLLGGVTMLWRSRPVTAVG